MFSKTVNPEPKLLTERRLTFFTHKCHENSITIPSNLTEPMILPARIAPVHAQWFHTLSDGNQFQCAHENVGSLYLEDIHSEAHPSKCRILIILFQVVKYLIFSRGFDLTTDTSNVILIIELF